MKLSTTVEATTTHEIRLEPKLKKQLLTRLHAYAALKQRMDELKAEMEGEKQVIGKLRMRTGEQSLKVEGFTVTEVRGVSHKLDKKKLISLGCAAAWIEEATVTTLKKAYELVTLPGEEKHGGE